MCCGNVLPIDILVFVQIVWQKFRLLYSCIPQCIMTMMVAGTNKINRCHCCHICTEEGSRGAAETFVSYLTRVFEQKIRCLVPLVTKNSLHVLPIVVVD